MGESIRHGRSPGGHGNEVHGAVQALRRVVTEVHRRFAAHADGSLSMADMHALHFIANDGPVTPGEIAAFTGLTSGSVTGLLDRLDRTGAIERRRSEADRRLVQIGLHPDAHRRMGGRMHHLHEEMAHFFHGWDVARIAEFTALLNDLRLHH